MYFECVIERYNNVADDAEIIKILLRVKFILILLYYNIQNLKKIKNEKKVFTS